MDRFAKLVTAALLLGAGAAHAGYAQLAQPAGFGGSPGNWTFAPSANDLRYGGTAYSPNALRVPVPGSAATMPVAYRFAANAPRIAAAAIFMNPYVRAAVGIATWLGVAGLVWDEVNKQWTKVIAGEETIIPNYEYSRTESDSWTTADAVCQSYTRPGGSYTFSKQEGLNYYSGCNLYLPSGFYDQYRSMKSRKIPCPANTIETPAGCVFQTSRVEPITIEEFQTKLPSSPMPDTVPWELPKPSPLPVEQPVINPDAVPSPVPRPLFVPTGDPVPNPQYDPNAAPGPDNQPWIQPGVRVNPSPTPDQPWRVDVQPVNRPVPGPEPMPAPDSENPTNPDKPSEEQIDFCVKNPDVLACQKLDEPNSEELPASEKPISISPDGGWGADNASCPAPKQIMVQGRAIPIPFDLFCTWASGMRPIIIAMAWLSAAFILLGARNES